MKTVDTLIVVVVLTSLSLLAIHLSGKCKKEEVVEGFPKISKSVSAARAAEVQKNALALAEAAQKALRKKNNKRRQRREAFKKYHKNNYEPIAGMVQHKLPDTAAFREYRYGHTCIDEETPEPVMYSNIDTPLLCSQKMENNHSAFMYDEINKKCFMYTTCTIDRMSAADGEDKHKFGVVYKREQDNLDGVTTSTSTVGVDANTTGSSEPTPPATSTTPATPQETSGVLKTDFEEISTTTTDVKQEIIDENHDLIFGIEEEIRHYKDIVILLNQISDLETQQENIDEKQVLSSEQIEELKGVGISRTLQNEINEYEKSIDDSQMTYSKLIGKLKSVLKTEYADTYGEDTTSGDTTEEQINHYNEKIKKLTDMLSDERTKSSQNPESTGVDVEASVPQINGYCATDPYYNKTFYPNGIKRIHSSKCIPTGSICHISSHNNGNGLEWTYVKNERDDNGNIIDIGICESHSKDIPVYKSCNVPNLNPSVLNGGLSKSVISPQKIQGTCVETQN